MRCFLCLASILGVVASIGAAGGHPQTGNGTYVALRGKVVGIEHEVVPEAFMIRVTVNMKLEFFNPGGKPAILLTSGSPVCVGTKVTKTPAPAVGNNVLFDDYRGPSIYGRPKWKLLHAALNQPEPPADLLRIIKPGDTMVEDSFVVLRPPIKLLKFKVRPYAPWESLKEASPVWLRLECEAWPRNVEPEPLSDKPNFGLELQKKWREFGDLQLNHIVSEPMELDLRQSKPVESREK
jgi:hypothetical protein